MKKIMKIIFSFVCLFILTGAQNVQAKEMKGSINIELEDGWAGTLKEGVEFKVIQIGYIIDGEYDLIDDLKYLDIDLDKIETANQLQETVYKILEEIKDKDFECLTKKTDKQGRVSFKNLNVGIYLVENTDRNNYDNVSATMISIPTYTENEEDMNYDVKVIPKHSPVIKVEISKQDIATSKELEGAKLTITHKKTGKIVDTWISGKIPHIIKDLESGETYILTELMAPKNYQLAQNVEFTVKDTGDVQKIVMYDELMPKVKTGDHNDYLLYAGLTMGSLGFMVLIFVKFYKIRKSDN